jgi:hypothetical protein
VAVYAPSERDRVSLCEVLDRVLNAGVVVVGEVVISVADVDLIFLGLQLTLTSVETANGHKLALSTCAQAETIEETA